MIGDSTMVQSWKALTCNLLSHSHTNSSNIQVSWVFHQGGSLEVHNIYTNRTCPFNATHCLIAGSSHVYFTQHNTNITITPITQYRDNSLQAVLLSLKTTPTKDTVFFNFGLHYNKQADMEKALKRFVIDIKNYTMKFPKPNLYFVESTPQHFATTKGKNGYYNAPDAAEWCEPLYDLTKAQDTDWRNRLLDTIIAKDGVVPIIRIAAALQTQYDAHIAGDSRLVDFEAADCTHWCSPGSVFPYIHTVQLNTVMQANHR